MTVTPESRDSRLFENYPGYIRKIVPNLEHILNRLIDIYSFDAGAVYLLRQTNQGVFDLKISTGFPRSYLEQTQQIFYGEGFSGTAAELRQIRVSEDIWNDHRFVRKGIKDLGCRSFISVPFYSEQTVWGLINLANYNKRLFSAEQLNALSFFGEQLGTSINSMLALLESQESEKTTKRLSALGEELARINDINQICVVVAEECRVLMKTPGAFVVLRNELDQSYATGINAETITEELIGVLSNQLTSDDFITLPRGSSKYPQIEEFLSRNNGEALYCLSLYSGESPLGLLGIVKGDSKEAGIDIKAFKRIRRQLCGVLTKYLYNKNSRTIAILEEQNRISRELHDSVAQQLLAMTNQTQYIQNLITGNPCDEVSQELQVLHDMFHQAYADLREAISGLRIIKPQVSRSFDVSLKQYLDFFRSTNAVEISAHIDPNLNLPLLVQIQLMRIIQEALANVRKHSQARHVDIAVRFNETTFQVVIADDGVGFDINSISAQCGLSIMQERVETIGGLFKISSAKNQGTTLFIEIDNNILLNLK